MEGKCFYNRPGCSGMKLSPVWFLVHSSSSECARLGPAASAKRGSQAETFKLFQTITTCFAMQIPLLKKL